FVAHEVAGFESLLDGLAQGFERVLVHLLEIHVLALKAGLKHVVRKSVEQVFQAHLVCQVADVFGVACVFHGFLSRAQRGNPTRLTNSSGSYILAFSRVSRSNSGDVNTEHRLTVNVLELIGIPHFVRDKAKSYMSTSTYDFGKDLLRSSQRG